MTRMKYTLLDSIALIGTILSFALAFWMGLAYELWPILIGCCFILPPLFDLITRRG